MSTRVLLVDDDAIVRIGLFSLLEKQPDIEVVGGVEDGREAVDAALALAPDLVIRDSNKPNPKSFDTTRKIVEKLKNVKVIALSIHSSRQFVAGMLKAGISFCILDCLFDELMGAIGTFWAAAFI